MTFQYLHFIGWYEPSPQNKVEIEAFSDRGAKVKTRRILSSLHIMYPTEKLDKIKLEIKK